MRRFFPSILFGIIIGIFASFIAFHFYFVNVFANKKEISSISSDVINMLPQVSQQQSAFVQEEKLMPSPLNGLPISQERAQLPVIAVVVENLQPARPQSSLSKADVIYETLVEGGITRFMAFFQSREADVVGPVRSARTYFAEIVREYDAWYAHVGGNADALRFIFQNKLHNLDQFFNPQPYWRDPVRRKKGLEHSMYANTNDLRAIVTGSFPDTFVSWQFLNSEKEKIQEDVEYDTIEIDFSYPAFKVRWNYDPVADSYTRSLGGVVHKDAQNDEVLSAKNIIVQYVKMSLVPRPPRGDEGALNMQLIGEGGGMLFRNGKSFSMTWRKSESGKRTRYYDESGEEMRLTPGVIWVELIGYESQVQIMVAPRGIEPLLSD